VFATVDRSRYSKCVICCRVGATVLCSSALCGQCYHFSCASKLGWNFEESTTFLCPNHNDADLSVDALVRSDVLESKSENNGDDIPNPTKSAEIDGGNVVAIDSSDDELEIQASRNVPLTKQGSMPFPITIPLAPPMINSKGMCNRSVLRLGRISRESTRDRWNVEFYATCVDNSSARILTIATARHDPIDHFEEGDIVKSVNGIRVGSMNMDTLQKFFSYINHQVEVLLEVRRLLQPSYY
jgi:hypothetical protein